MTNPILGELSYLAACIESTWGTLPGSPTWVQLPVASYGVKQKQERRKSNTFVGVMQDKHYQTVYGMPSGSITTPLFGWWPANASMSQMEFWLTFILSTSGSALESQTRPPRSFFWAEGPNTTNRIHTGCVCGGYTISGSAGGSIVLQVDISGYDEIGMDDATARADTAPTLVTDRKKLTEVIFEDSALTLSGGSTEMKAFSLKGNFNLKIGREDSSKPTFIIGGHVNHTLNLTVRKTADTWQENNRNTDGYETTAALVLKGLHRGTGTGGTDWTLATLTFNRLSLTDDPTEGGKDPLYQNLAFECLKPDSSSHSITWAMSEV